MRKPKFELNLPDDPLLPGNIRRQTPASLIPPQNWHENTEIVYCVSGSGYVKINDRVIDIAKGDLVVINSEMFHSVHSWDLVTPMQYLCVTIDRSFCMTSGIATTDLSFREKIQDEALAKAFLAIYDAYNVYLKTKAFYRAALVRARALEFMFLLCRDYLIEETNPSASNRSTVVHKAMVYIKQNLSSKLTLDDIARSAGISKNHLSREFKKVSGQTVFAMILQLRCDAARRLIEQGVSVSEAARAYGFENLSYFTRTFKRYHQGTPSHYIKR